MSSVTARTRRLSPLRLLVAVVATAAVIGAGVFWVRGLVADALAPAVQPAWFASYVDVTATPEYAFESPASDAQSNVVLSFVVADPASACTPSWGGAYSLDDAATSLDLDRRIARLEQNGGFAAVSFGGQANSELSATCTDVTALQKAYAAVVDRYSLSTIDLDLEGDGLGAASVQRGATAIAALQSERRDSGHPLAVWLTLPVTPDGLASAGTDAVAAYLAAGVDLAGVNAMTMDYGESLTDGTSMIDGTTAALTAVHRQLGILYSNAGTSLSSQTLWSKVGATPMIGQNDTVDEVFSIADAKALNAFARTNALGRLSMWSANRDATCSPNYADTSVVSDLCSGVDQGSSSFATVLASHITGTPDAVASTTTSPEPVPTSMTDDPATSPYAIWNASAVYLAGTKTVWHHNVYEAKWWTRGDTPDDPVLQASESPWTLLGPVLPGETPVPVPTLPAGTYATWSGTKTYVEGDRVMLDGVAYEAKWWTTGDSPAGASTDADNSPWHILTAREIQAVLDAG